MFWKQLLLSSLPQTSPEARKQSCYHLKCRDRKEANTRKQNLNFFLSNIKFISFFLYPWADKIFITSVIELVNIKQPPRVVYYSFNLKITTWSWYHSHLPKVSRVFTGDVICYLHMYLLTNFTLSFFLHSGLWENLEDFPKNSVEGHFNKSFS